MGNSFRIKKCRDTQVKLCFLIICNTYNYEISNNWKDRRGNTSFLFHVLFLLTLSTLQNKLINILVVTLIK